MNRGLLHARVAELEAAFREVGATRMAGVPVQNPRLRVQAVGFAAEGGIGLGVLVTPWFMNLMRLPLDDAARATLAAPRDKRLRDCGTLCFEFIGGHEERLGAFEACSLFSPMFEFADQAAAVATAQAVLQGLQPPVVAARRGFLFGRGAAGAAA